MHCCNTDMFLIHTNPFTARKKLKPRFELRKHQNTVCWAQHVCAMTWRRTSHRAETLFRFIQNVPYNNFYCRFWKWWTIRRWIGCDRAALHNVLCCNIGTEAFSITITSIAIYLWNGCSYFTYSLLWKRTSLTLVTFIKRKCIFTTKTGRWDYFFSLRLKRNFRLRGNKHYKELAHKLVRCVK
jgi:hypothetical protein